MCGFAGFLDKGLISYDPEAILSAMGDSISHRGPDDCGEWFDSAFNLGLSHRRLSVLDISLAGHQPMNSLSGRFVLVYNGEIYNHLELRKLLKQGSSSTKFKGNSDTETLLCCFETWGIEATVKCLRGMFAFSVWDNQKKSLVLVRDRAGEKPLYYGWQNNVFLFGSDLKALKQHPKFNAEINRGSISLLLRHNCIPAPHSIYKDIFKLEPGNMLEITLSSRKSKKWSYWSLKDVVSNPKFKGTADEAVSKLENLALDAVKSQMLSDVPIGAFLSGGVDSSAVASLMQSQSFNPIKTFSIGFNEQKYNEAEYAKKIAKHLGAEHTELYISSKDAMNVIPKLSELYSEPFSDSSQIPTFLLSELAKKDVTVSLSGDAGDELFCGYNRYMLTNRLWKYISILPKHMRSSMAKVMMSIPIKKWDDVSAFIPGARNLHDFGGKIHKGASVLESKSIDELYLGLVSHFINPESFVINGVEPLTSLTSKNKIKSIERLNNVEKMMALDFLTYLPDDILTKVDRASMGVSLEARVPFLDHRIIEFAWSLPLSIKIRGGNSKWPLRHLLNKYVPKELIDRPKMGFSMPVDLWLRGPLRNWAEELLNEDRLSREGYFHSELVGKMWNEHILGKNNWQHQLWSILMFQAWLENENK
jgi:asparagine synthase (glutamine-hydrolysing)